MKERNFDEMIAYFNRRVSEMDIAQDYKMELLGMVTALGYKHEKTAQPEIVRCKDCKHFWLGQCGLNGLTWSYDSFYSRAERREEHV